MVLGGVVRGGGFLEKLLSTLEVLCQPRWQIFGKSPRSGVLAQGLRLYNETPRRASAPGMLEHRSKI